MDALYTGEWSYMIVKCWFRMFYEAVKPQVELRNQHLTILVAVTTDPLTY